MSFTSGDMQLIQCWACNESYPSGTVHHCSTSLSPMFIGQPSLPLESTVGRWHVVGGGGDGEWVCCCTDDWHMVEPGMGNSIAEIVERLNYLEMKLE